MVPPSELSSLFTSTPLHLPRLPAATVLPQPATTDPTLAAATSMLPPSQYPTPGMAYEPYTGLYTQRPPMYNPPQPPVGDARDSEVAQLTAQVVALADQVRHLTALTAASPQPMEAPMPVALAQLTARPRPMIDMICNSLPSRSMDGFATVTSSSGEASRATTHAAPPSSDAGRRGSDDTETLVSEHEADELLLPVPAAAAGAAGARTESRAQIFTSKEIESLACSCIPDAVGAWDVMFLGRLESKNAVAHRILLYTNTEIAAMSPAARAVVRGYDCVLGGHLLATLQADTPQVKLRRAKIATREKKFPGTITSSGRAIRNIILEIIEPTYGSELDALEKELKKPFFAMGMDDTTIQLKANRLEALRSQLPASARGGERELLRALIKKFPPQLAAEAKKYKADMCKAEVQRTGYEWTYEELTAMLSAHITGEEVAEANAAEAPTARGGGGGGEAALFTVNFRGCLHCGLDGHSTRECIVEPCGYCGLRFCFGIRKRGNKRDCLTKKVVNGGKVTNADVGFNGRPLPPALIDQINDKAGKLKAAGAAKETNAAEAQTEPNVSYLDEEEVCVWGR